MTERTEHPDQDDDELDLVPEALKDLTASPELAGGVVGGNTTPGDECECGTL